MTTIHASLICDRDELHRRASPRDDIIIAESAPNAATEGDAPVIDPSAPNGSVEFGVAHGPFRRYRRQLSWRTDESSGAVLVDQRIEYRLAIPYWAALFDTVVKRRMTDGIPAGVTPWWATPDRLSASQASMVAAAAMLSVVTGAMFGLLTQVLTFTSADLGNGSAAQQAQVLVVVRLGTVLTVIAMVAADRLGRRRIGLWALLAAVLLSIAAAASPTLLVFTILQFVSRNLAMAGLLCVDTIVVEELPAGSRAMAAGLTTLAYGLGAGFVVVLLPLADLGPWGWRLTFAASVLALPALWHSRRFLPESERFRHHAAAVASAAGAVRTRINRSRLVVIGAMFFLLNVFIAPASQLQNDYLRTDRGFDGLTITVFTVLTATPGAIGVLAGGRLADLRGRRAAIIPGLLAVGVFGAATFVLAGPGMWLAAVLAAVLGALSAPALGVIAPELFPTGRRGGTRGTVNAIAVAGSVSGLVTAGALIGPSGYGTTFALLALAPAVAAVLALRVPETTGKELEELN